MNRIAFTTAFMIAAVFLAVVILFAAPAAVVSASGSGETVAEKCLACHPRAVAGEVHGLGLSNPQFRAAWTEAGEPKECLSCHTTGYDKNKGTWAVDIISCEACHSPISEDHPSEPMPVNRSNALCARCHNENGSGSEDPKTSTHYQQSMLCTNCHDPHMPRGIQGEDTSAPCKKCHDKVSERAEHSTHTDAGVSCIQCHLGPEKNLDQYHMAPDHNFLPVIETCNSCHAQQMHDPKPTPTAPTPTPTRVVPTATPQPTATPLPDPTVSVTPFNTMDFTFMGAGLLALGVIGGLALSPVLDWVSRMMGSKKQ